MGIWMQSSGKSKKKEEELRKQGCRAVLRVRRREKKVEGLLMLSGCLE